jgi:hypothetical protein
MSTKLAVGQSLFNHCVGEIHTRHNRLREVGRGFDIFASELLRRVSAEVGYRPSAHPRNYLAHLEALAARASAHLVVSPETLDFRERHAELTKQSAALDARLASFTSASGVPEVADALSRRAALDFLLSRIPRAALEPDAPIVSVLDAATAAIQAELSTLRAWTARLRAERTRIQREIEQAQRDGRAAEFTGVGGTYLLLELSAVVWALDEATACEKLAKEKYGDVSPAVRMAELLGKSSTVEA